MIKTAAAIVSLVLLIAAAVVYLPYLGWSDDVDAARERAAAYLQAVSGGAEDRGWSYLLDPWNGPFGSDADYRTVMAEADWSRFEWVLTEQDRCDDGVCTLYLRLPNGWESAPSVLRRDENSDPGILQLLEGTSEIGDASIEVIQRGPFGGTGIVIFGR